MTARARLPNRRATTYGFDCCGLSYLATFSRFPAEIFIFNYKVNSQADTNAKDAAVVCSLALLRDSRGNANGPLGHALDLLAENTR
jgi:hypothetical protein